MVWYTHCTNTDNTVKTSIGNEVNDVIHIDYRDAKPIYEQIKEGYRRLIVSGVMAQGEKLPSVREVATSLTINPNTIQRAYRELEAEGYIYSVAGKGSFVSEHREVNNRRYADLLKQLEETVRELLFLGATKSDLIARLESLQ
jgi:GntR family transcriptional regulator